MDNNFVYVVSMDGTYNAKMIRNPAVDMITIIGIFENEYDAGMAIHDTMAEYPGINRAAIKIDKVCLNKRYNIEHEPDNNTYVGEINLIF